MIMLNTQLGVLVALSPLVRVSMHGDMYCLNAELDSEITVLPETKYRITVSAPIKYGWEHVLLGQCLSTGPSLHG